LEKLLDYLLDIKKVTFDDIYELHFTIPALRISHSLNLVKKMFQNKKET